MKADNIFKKEKQKKTCKRRWITGQQMYHVIRFSVAFGPFVVSRFLIHCSVSAHLFKKIYFNAKSLVLACSFVSNFNYID